MMRLAALGLVALAVAAAGSGASERALAPLHGTALRGVTGLRLVVADNPPQVLDVDSGRATRLGGVPAPRRRELYDVVAAGGRAALVVGTVYPRSRMYAARLPGPSVRYLGTGSRVTPAAVGGAWIESRGRSGCMVREVSFTGRLLRAARRFPCGLWSDPPGSRLGVVVRRTRIVDPATGRTVYRAPAGIIAVSQRYVVVLHGHALVVMDTKTGAERRLGWPSTLSGSDTPAVDPQTGRIALAFADPAWPGGGQALDVWVLEPRTGRLVHLPATPATVALKRTSMEWTDDGRLVLLAESGARQLVAIWRPGATSLAIRKVRLRTRFGASDSFAVLRVHRRA